MIMLPETTLKTFNHPKPPELNMHLGVNLNPTKTKYKFQQKRNYNNPRIVIGSQTILLD